MNIFLSRIRRFLFLSFLTITSCKSIHNIAGYSKWNVQSQYSSSIFAKLEHSAKTIYISQNNTSGNYKLDDSIAKTKEILLAKGFTIVQNQSEADFKILVNHRLFNRIDGKYFNEIKDYWNAELSSFLLDKQLMSIHKKNQIQHDIANYARYSEGDSKIAVMAKDTYNEASTKATNKTLLSEAIIAYRDFDISGLILGNLIGYAIGTPQAIIYGTIGGGFAFEVLSKLTEPRSYLLITDIQVSEKSPEQVFETDKRAFMQDDNGVRRSEFTNKVNYINYRTSVFMVATRVMGGEDEASNQMLQRLPSMIASSINY